MVLLTGFRVVGFKCCVQKEVVLSVIVCEGGTVDNDVFVSFRALERRMYRVEESFRVDV